MSLGFNPTADPILFNIWMPVTTAAVPVLYLRAVLKYYLRLDRPFLVAFLATTIGMLTSAVFQNIAFSL
ncbi:MAG: hypothetical protein IPK83_03700 [Planctomycetes bacterium]|nr:hypothetical protein [Planctomycetota bacterium]